ncbi:MAG: nucleotidyltransferase family protein, partial [Caldimicrobium sp.]
GLANEWHKNFIKGGRAMKSLEEIKSILSSHLSEIKEKFGVKEIGIFGSYVRGEETGRSDIDILVEFEHPVDFFLFLELEEYLQKLIGVKVDLVMKKALKPEIRKYILNKEIRKPKFTPKANKFYNKTSRV